MATPQQLMIAQRKKARHYAVQALYQWQMAGAEPAQIEAEFRADYDMSKVDVEYFHDVLHGVVTHNEALSADIEPLLVDRSLKDLDAVELSLLRVGAFELRERVDIPYRVVINEGVSLAKKFGATDGHKFINGVLDKLATQLRPTETAQAALNKKS